MKTIWKWEIFLQGPTGVGPNGEVETVIQMPVGAEILSVHVQDEAPRMWTLVDPFAPTETRVFVVYKSGFLMPDDPGKYIGTVLLEQGQFALHVFERGNS